MSILMSGIKSDSAFTFPAVDKSNHRYHLLVKGFNNRGRLRLEKGDKNQAIADFKRALKIDPDFSKAYRILSRLLLSKSKHRIDKDVKALPFEKDRPMNPEAN